MIGTTRVLGILDVDIALLLSCRGQRSVAVCAGGRQKFYHEGLIVRWKCEHSAASLRYSPHPHLAS
jgi:hypothetical protein